MDGVSRSGDQIHLPQTLSEERSRDELSDWEQVSSRAAERFAPREPVPRLPIHCSAWRFRTEASVWKVEEQW